MAYVTVDIDPAEILDELPAADLEEALRHKRGQASGAGDKSDSQLLDEIVSHFRSRDMPDCLRQYLNRHTSRIF